MARFVVDCGVVLQLAGEEIDVHAEHELLAPTLLRSQTLSALHEAVNRGEVPPDIRCTHPAAGRRVRDPGRGTGAPGERDRSHGDGRRTANGVSRAPAGFLWTDRAGHAIMVAGCW